MRVLDVALTVAGLSAVWLAGAVIVACGLHLFRRADTMLGYGYSWKDAGTQMRATRRRKDGRAAPVSHKEPEKPSDPLASLEELQAAMQKPKPALTATTERVRSGETMVVHHAGNRTGLWGRAAGGEGGPPSGGTGSGAHSDRSLWGVDYSRLRHGGSPPWTTAEQPAVTDDTMTLQQPVADSDAAAD